MQSQALLERLFQAARDHATDAGEPDVTVGDLEELAQHLWDALPPHAREATLAALLRDEDGWVAGYAKLDRADYPPIRTFSCDLDGPSVTITLTDLDGQRWSAQRAHDEVDRPLLAALHDDEPFEVRAARLHPLVKRLWKQGAFTPQTDE